MDQIDNPNLTTAAQVTSHYAPPSERVLKKELDHVDA